MTFRPFGRALATSALAAALLALPTATAFAVADDAALPNIDVRVHDTAAVPAAAKAARSALDKQLGPATGEVTTDAATGAIDHVGATGALLTGPSTADARTIVLDYVNRHAGAYGLHKGDLAHLQLVASATSPDGITHLRFDQVLDGVQSFDSGISAAVTRDGRLVSIDGSPLPGATLGSADAELSAVDGLAAARDAVDGSGVPSAPAKTAGGTTTFSSGETARLLWVATADGPQLVWQVIARGAGADAYDTLVSAADGSLVRRQDLDQKLGAANWFPRNPAATPAVAKVMPPAWYDDSASGTRLWGENAHTYSDPYDRDPATASAELSAANVAQIPASNAATLDWSYLTAQAVTPAGWMCPSSGCTWYRVGGVATAAPNLNEAGTNLHVLVSGYHDYLAQAPIGFDQSSGNFQATNSPGVGHGGDYVRAEVNDSSSASNNGTAAAAFDNANFETFPDGTPGRMQMYLWGAAYSGVQYYPNVNGSDDADVVYHEYTHGLSNRLVVNAAGSSTLSSIQATAMGEAWSDYYALDKLQGDGLITDAPGVADVKMGPYVTGGAGIRAKPIDCPVNAAAPAGDGCNDNGNASYSIVGGYTYGDLSHTNLDSPHNPGEIWAETLWQIRTKLIADLGPTAGRNAALTLITGGMRMSPANPSMLDERNAILAEAVAIRSAPGAGDDYSARLWTIFAARGMGVNAVSANAATTAVTENFDLPFGVRVQPLTFSDPYPGGDNDGVVEAGETIVVGGGVTNQDPTSSTGITGTLTATGGLSLVNATSTWPTLESGATGASTTPLTVRVNSCTTTGTVTLAATSATGSGSSTATIDPRPGNHTSIALNDATGHDDASTADNGVTTSSFVAAGSGNASDVDIRIGSLRHSYLNDIKVEVTHDGVTVVLINRPGTAAAGYANIIDTTFDSSSATAVPGNSGLHGTYHPVGSLDAFNGHPVAGTWTLTVTDNYDGDSGSIDDWSIVSPQLGCNRAEIPVATTGDAADATGASATLAGWVTPNGRATGLRFAWGTTTAYGNVTATQDIGAGDAPVARTAAIAGLQAGTTYHFRTESIREGGVVAVVGDDHVFTTPGGAATGGGTTGGGGAGTVDPVGAVLGGGGGSVATPTAIGTAAAAGPDRTAPALLGKVKVSLAKAVGKKFAANKRPTFAFTLSERGAVTVVLTKATPGSKAGAKCGPVKRGGKPCVRQVAAGAATVADAKPGAGSLTWAAKGLARGTYVATIVVTDLANNRSAPATVTFTVK